MKAISLWQPWATGMALGLKTNETRGFATKHRGWLAIHAAQRWTEEQRAFLLARRQAGDLSWDGLPFGKIVAVVHVDDVLPTAMMAHISEQERAWGVYSDGRFAWITSRRTALAEPVPCKGQQGMWKLDPHIEEQVVAQIR